MDTLNFAANMSLVGLQVLRGERKEVRAKLEMKITDTEALGFFGEDFKRLAFGDMQIVKLDDEEGGDVEPRFQIKRKIMDELLDQHIISMLKNESVVRPRIVSLTPVKGERAVHMIVAVTFVANEASRAFIGELAERFDDQFLVTFKPAQTSLPLAGSAEDGTADDDDESDDDENTVEAPGARRGRRRAADAAKEPAAQQ